MRFALLSSLFVLLVACGETPATQTLVWFTAPDEVLARAATLEVRVLTGDGEVATTTTRSIDDEPALSFPATQPVVPEGGDATRTFSVVAILRDAAGDAIGEGGVRSGFVRDALREVWVCLAPECVSGACEPRLQPPSDVGLVDPGSVCGSDTDAGPGDAAVDAMDGGPDAPSCSCPCASDACIDGECVPRAFASVAAGTHHACAVDAESGLFCWGLNTRGELGLGDTDTRRIPTRVSTAADVIGVATGVEHTCAVLDDGSVACWGSNERGRCGQPPTGEDLLSPTVVGAGRDWRQIDVGPYSSCGTRSDGIYCWGSNADGQLGIGAGFTGEAERPQLVSTRYGVVNTGDSFACAIRDTSWTSYCWGESGSGRLAQGDATISDMDSPYRPPYSTEPHLALSLGDAHALSIGREGILRGWGSNRQGQLGVPNRMPFTGYQVELTTETDWVAASAGNQHSCAIRSDPGILVCFGRGESGQLGNGDTASGYERRLVGDPGWSAVSAGDGFSCGIRDDGTLHCWGDNAFGQLGQGDVIGRTTPARLCHPG